ERARPISGAFPTSRTAAGRQLPRAYVARRRPLARDGHVSTLETRPADVRQPPEEAHATELDGAIHREVAVDVAPPSAPAHVDEVVIELPAPVPVHDEMASAPHEDPFAPTHAEQTAPMASGGDYIEMPAPASNEGAAPAVEAEAAAAATIFSTAPSAARGS